MELPHNAFTQCTRTALILTERDKHCSFWVHLNISFPVYGRRLGTYVKKLSVHSALCHSVCRARSDTVQCSTAVDTMWSSSGISFTLTAVVTAASCVLAAHISQQGAHTDQPCDCRYSTVLALGDWATDVTQPYTDPAVTLVLCPTVHARTIQMQSQRSFPKLYAKYFPDDGRTQVDTFRK